MPLIVVPSKLFHSTISGAGSTSGLKPPTSLVVQRVNVPSEASIEKTSPYVFTFANVKASCLELGRQPIRVMTPTGIPRQRPRLHRAQIEDLQFAPAPAVEDDRDHLAVGGQIEAAVGSTASDSDVSGVHVPPARSPRHSLMPIAALVADGVEGSTVGAEPRACPLGRPLAAGRQAACVRRS